MITKKEYSAPDAQASVLYAKRDANSTMAYPVLASMLNPGLAIPEHDAIELSYTGDDMTGVVYKLLGTTVATLTLSYTSGNLVGVVKT